MRRFWSDQKGNVAVFTAIVMLPLIAAIGGAVDLAMSMRTNTKVQSALDSAALAGARELEVGGKAQAETVIKRVLAAHMIGEFASIPVAITVDEKAGNVELKASGSLPTTFLRVVKLDTMPVNRSAKAARKIGAFIDIYLLIDKSESMNLAADEVERAKLEAFNRKMYGPAIKSKYGNNITTCEFACHRYDGWGPAGSTPYSIARAQGIKLRIDVLEAAVDTFIDKTLKSSANSSGQQDIRVSTAGFSNTYEKGLFRSKDIVALQQSYRNITAANDHTFTDRALQGIRNDMGLQGDGSTVDKPYKILVLITDGVHDTNSNNSGIWPVSSPDCDAVKKRGIPLSVLEVKYIQNTSSYFFNNNFRGGRYDTISPGLYSCSSPGLFFTASDSSSAELDRAFSELLAGLRARAMRLVR